MEEGESVEERAEGLLKIIQAQYLIRSESWLKNKLEHLKFESFASHWLYSNGALYDKDVVFQLHKKYPLPS